MADGESDEETGGLFGFVTRRRLLKLGLGAVAIPVVAATGLLGLRGCAPDVDGLAQLGDQGYRTLMSLAAVHIPRGGAFDVGADDFDLARVFDRFLANEPDENISALKNALTLLEFGPVVFDRRAATFSNLDEAERLAHWQSWMQSDRALQRTVATAFRRFLSLVFYDQPAVWPHIGYPGPSLAALGAQGAEGSAP